MLFPEAAKVWLLSRQNHLAPRTYIDYGNHIKVLSPFFRKVVLNDITGDMLRDYQRQRRVTAGPSLLNRECGIIRQMGTGQAFLSPTTNQSLCRKNMKRLGGRLRMKKKES
jgi:hypothetical protein